MAVRVTARSCEGLIVNLRKGKSTNGKSLHCRHITFYYTARIVAYRRGYGSVTDAWTGDEKAHVWASHSRWRMGIRQLLQFNEEKSGGMEHRPGKLSPQSIKMAHRGWCS